jgi:hypothetical protein
MNTYQTAKSSRAQDILHQSHILDYLDVIAKACWINAYGEEIDINNIFEFLPYDKCGKMPIFSKIPHYCYFNNIGHQRLELDFIKKHFYGGFNSILFYYFSDMTNLILKLLIEDELIKNKSESFTLISHIKISDYRYAHNFSVEAFTQPIIDCQDSVSQTLFWHELNR